MSVLIHTRQHILEVTNKSYSKRQVKKYDYTISLVLNQMFTDLEHTFSLTFSWLLEILPWSLAFMDRFYNTGANRTTTHIQLTNKIYTEVKSFKKTMARKEGRCN